MGLIKALLDSGSQTIKDQYLEYIYCPPMGEGVLGKKGIKQNGTGSNHGADNIITNGSVVAVQENQGMLIVEDGKIVDFTLEPGRFTWDKSTEPSLFFGGLGAGLKDSIKKTWERTTFGSETGKDQRVYFINLMPQMGKKFGTPTPIPYEDMGFIINIGVNGVFKYTITNFVNFYKNLMGNVDFEFKLKEEQLDQLKSEMISNLTSAVQSLAYMQPSTPVAALNTKNREISEKLKEFMVEWDEKYGINIESITLNGVTPVQDAQYKEYLDFRKKVSFGSNQAAMVGGNAVAMQQRVGGTYIDENGAIQAHQMGGNGTNGAMDMMGMAMMGGMMGNMGMGNPLYPQSQQPVQGAPIIQQNPSAQIVTPATSTPIETVSSQKEDSWTCECGSVNTGKFCMECGGAKPVVKESDSWICDCGHENTGKFCMECGNKKPDTRKRICDKCGWTPVDGEKFPKFCPECGDVFDDNDIEVN